MAERGSRAVGLDASAVREARSLIGVPLRRPLHNQLVSHSAIKRWAKSIGDRNPLWLDPDYAAGSALGRSVAPPCWLYSVDDTCIAPKLSDLHVIYGGVEWEFYRWLQVGERVTAQSQLLGVREATGRFCGPMLLQTGETVFSGQDSHPVAKATSQVIRAPRLEAVRAAKYGDWRKHTFSAEEELAIEDAYDAEEVRSGQPRYWEDVGAAELLPPMVRGPLTSEEIIQFVGATRPSLGFKRFLRHRLRHPGAAFLDSDTGAWESWEASLLRDDVARMFGFPFAHDCGIDRISWASSLVTNWMGDLGFLKALSIRLALPNIYGDATWCRGQVTRLYREGGQHLVQLAVWCENQRGQQTAYGRAMVALPSRKVQ
jgi:acyl dehydratase